MLLTLQKMYDFRHIRPAHPGEWRALTDLMRTSKAYWGYTQQQMSLWESELSVSESDIRAGFTHLAEIDDEQTSGKRIGGFYSLVVNGNHATLEHFFVAPCAIGLGIGRALLAHAIQEARQQVCSLIAIDADPNAELFYLHHGARKVAEISAPIIGDQLRVRPQLHICL